MLTLRSAASSPYAVLAAGQRPQRQRKRSLLSMSRLAEAQTLAAPKGAMVLAVLQERHHYTPRTQARYEALAARGVQVVLFAHGWTGVAEVSPGLRLAGLEVDDVARDEWDLLVLTPRKRFGFVSLDTRMDDVAELDREFDWVSSTDAEALGRAGDALLRRLPSIPLTVPPIG